MKAVYKPNREKGIKIADVPIPKISENEVLVKVKKAAICGTESIYMTGIIGVRT